MHFKLLISTEKCSFIMFCTANCRNAGTNENIGGWLEGISWYFMLPKASRVAVAILHAPVHTICSAWRDFWISAIPIPELELESELKLMELELNWNSRSCLELKWNWNYFQFHFNFKYIIPSNTTRTKTTRWRCPIVLPHSMCLRSPYASEIIGD